MSDPKYNTYAGELRFDDDNIVDVNLEPDTENITVRLNGEEITGGSELPEVDSGDNGKVLTVVSGEWAAANPAAPPAELPAVTSSDNGDVLTVVSGAWAKATPSGGGGGSFIFDIEVDAQMEVTTTVTYAQILAAYTNGQMPVCRLYNDPYTFLPLTEYDPSDAEEHHLGKFTFSISNPQATQIVKLEFSIADVDPSTHESALTFHFFQYTYSGGVS